MRPARISFVAKNLLALAVLSLGVTVVARPTNAKDDEIQRLRVCGRMECRVLAEINAIRAIATGVGANTHAGRPPRAPYYTLRPVPRIWSFQGYVYVPARRVAMLKWAHRPGSRYRVEWLAPTLKRVTRGMAPHGPPRSWSRVVWP